MIELQEVMDKQSQEQSQMKERLAALSAHVTELEEDLDTARKDLLKSEEVNTKLQGDVREVSDGGRVCCPEVDCGSLVLPVISALGRLREQEQGTGVTVAGGLPASVSQALGSGRSVGSGPTRGWPWHCAAPWVWTPHSYKFWAARVFLSGNSCIHPFSYWRIAALHCCVGFCCTAG